MSKPHDTDQIFPTVEIVGKNTPDGRESLYARVGTVVATFMGAAATYFLLAGMPGPKEAATLGGVNFSGLGLRDRLPAALDVFSHVSNIALTYPVAFMAAAVSAWSYRLASNEFSAPVARKVAVAGTLVGSYLLNRFFYEGGPAGGKIDNLDTVYGTLGTTALIAMVLGVRRAEPSGSQNEAQVGPKEEVELV